MTIPKLHIQNLNKRFGNNGETVIAADSVTFDVSEGEVLALLGPSGCGKTTTLRMIAGFEQPDSGTIAVDGNLFNDDKNFIRPEKRDIGVVFQDLALFPHLDVIGNVMFGLRHLDRSSAHKRAMEMIQMVGLGDLPHRKPEELSGGQQQRVAVARAMAPAPRLILLDEPFSGLDASLRQSTRQDIRELLQQRGMTAVLVTHDQEEALTFADRITVMRDGRLIQAGYPDEVYFQPRTAFVATFLGQTNLLDVQANGKTAQSALGPLPLNESAQGSTVVSIRPEHLEIGPPHADRLQGTVIAREFKGHDLSYTVLADGTTYRIHTHFRCTYRENDAVSIHATEPAVVVADDRADTVPARQ